MIANALLEYETLTSEQIYALAEGKTADEVFNANSSFTEQTTAA